MQNHTPNRKRLRLPVGRRMPAALIALAVASLLAIGMAPQANARSAAKETSTDRPRIGLVLSGGGALGIAHVGVIKVLEEMGIRPDLVVGTSMGAVVGGLYAAGYSGEELEQLVLDIDWLDLLNDTIPRKDLIYRRKQDDARFLIPFRLRIKNGRLRLPGGAIEGEKLMLALRDLTEPIVTSGDFKDLPLPFRAVAADIETGEAVVLQEGNLATAMRASMAVPAVFPPVELDGRVLIDGGLTNNIPIDVAREMGADIVIVVRFNTKRPTAEEISSLFAITGQALNLMLISNGNRQLATLGEEDVLINVDLVGYSSASFDKAPELIEPGVTAAQEARESLSRLPQSPSRRPPETRTNPVISFVDLDSNSVLNDQVILKRLDVPLGQPLDIVDLNRQLLLIYGLGYFERVDYQIVRRGNETGLLVIVRDKSNGLTTLRASLQIENNFSGDSQFNLGAEITRFGVTGKGGELRGEFFVGDDLSALAEFYQPLTNSQTWFARAQVSGQAFDAPIFDENGQRAAEYRVEFGAIDLDLGYQFNDFGALALGYEIGSGRARVETGDPSLEEIDISFAQLRAAFDADRLDSPGFPRNGYRFTALHLEALEVVGSDVDYAQSSAGGAGFVSLGRNTLFGAATATYTTRGTAPIEAQPALGGLFNLSGLERNEIAGQHALFGSLGYYRDISASTESFIRMPIYVGGTLEAGNVFQSRDEFEDLDLRYSGSVFLGANTFLGPVYLGYGMSEGGERSLALFVGQSF